jgi:hypothetical protein
MGERTHLAVRSSMELCNRTSLNFGASKSVSTKRESAGTHTDIIFKQSVTLNIGVKNHHKKRGQASYLLPP